MNGDLLTTLDIGALLEHHRESGNVAHDRDTPASASQIDYGVLHLDDGTDASRVSATRRSRS